MDPTPITELRGSLPVNRPGTPGLRVGGPARKGCVDVSSHMRALKLAQPVPTRTLGSQPPVPLPGYIHR